MNVSFKEQCILLRKKGHTLSEIVHITRRPKSSVYGYICNFPLSPKRLSDIREASGKRIRKFALARKGKSVRPFLSFKKWSPETVTLAAHLLFDGGIYTRSGCVYNSRSKILINRVEEYMRLIYIFEPIRYTNTLTGVSRISYHNVALAIYMKKKVRELLRNVRNLPPSLKSEFVRAFFNDEGCVDYRPENNRRSIRGYQKDVKILRLIQTLLHDFDIESRIILPNEVVIVGKENLSQFEKKIGFLPGIYINGDRSNSRWKKHIEKRELLKQAIASFKS